MTDTTTETPTETKTGAKDALEPRFVDLIAAEVGCNPRQVAAASALFAEKATVPFVARYRKEATGGLLDEQLETIHKRREYFLELADRRDAILASIEEQGKLTDELEAKIRAATGKQELEDLYLPYKPKRRTRAQIAREKGLEPLADRLLEGAAEGLSASELAAAFVDAEKGVADAEEALAGARDVLAERLAEDAGHRAELRKTLHRQGELEVRVLAGKEEEGKVFQDYFDHREPAGDVPSHRLLAILRGEREGFLISDLKIDDDAEVERLAASWRVPLDGSCGRQLALATADGYKRLLRPSITNEVRGELRDRAEAEAISVFRDNLEALLMQAPLGQVPVMGLDPGYRTGCKVAVVDRTGRVVATDVIYAVLSEGRGGDGGEEPGRVRAAREKLLRLIAEHEVHAVAIGNGTASRETEAFARRTVQDAAADDPRFGKVIVAIVPETGASVYSASAVAREELPELDVSLRGAVSIARRMQDPLAELVKIEPRSMGVGQYQHDVDQRSLAGELDLAVETTVNRVGVELNTASPSLLSRVSGLSERLARKIVEHRDQRGAYPSRQALLEVSGFGPKTFEQAAGFLRVAEGEHPLDRTAVHPERYGVVEKMAAGLGLGVEELVGDPKRVAGIRFEKFVGAEEGLGHYTLEDIRAELERPGRDPRPEYKAPEWREDVRSLEDLKPGMVLEGRVSNVTNFGAFVDLGVKRDGLVHVSELSHDWIDDPRQAVKAGEIVKVKVMEVDRDRERISLSIKQLQPPPARPRGRRGGPEAPSPRPAGRPKPSRPASVEDLAAKFNRRR